MTKENIVILDGYGSHTHARNIILTLFKLRENSYTSEMGVVLNVWHSSICFSISIFFVIKSNALYTALPCLKYVLTPSVKNNL